MSNLPKHLRSEFVPLRKAGKARTRQTPQDRESADAAYRRALGLEPGEPLPKNIGSA